MLLIKAAPIVPALCSASSSLWLLWRLQEVDSIGECVNVCVSFLIRNWCVMPFHPAIIATGSKEHLHLSRSGAHHWEDEKFPTVHRLPSLKKPPWVHTSHFFLPSHRKGKRGGLRRLCAAAFFPPVDPCPCNRGPQTQMGLWVYYLMMKPQHQPLAVQQVQVLGASPVGVSVMEAGSGLLIRPVSFQLHLKGALKLEVTAHLMEA